MLHYSFLIALYDTLQSFALAIELWATQTPHKLLYWWISSFRFQLDTEHTLVCIRYYFVVLLEKCKNITCEKMPRTTIPTHAAKNAKVWVDNVIRYNFAQSYRNRGKTVLIIRYKPLQKYYFEFMWSRCDFFKHCTLINNCCQKESKSYKHCILRILYISVSSLLYFWILTWMWYLFISLLISVACTF